MSPTITLGKGKEKAIIVCRAASSKGADMHRVSTKGGIVHIKMFNPSTCEELNQEYLIPKSGVLEVEIPYGYHYQVYSTLEGYGASFRLTFTACTPKRYAHLWNFEIGTYAFGTVVLSTEDDSAQRLIPQISTDGTFGSFSAWDAGNGDSYDYNGITEIGEEHNYDKSQLQGIVVSAADCSVLIMADAKSLQTKYWSKQNYGRSVPGLEEYYETYNHNYEEAQAAASLDFDGNLNTDKVLSALIDCPAALFACQSGSYQAQRYLPGAGELKALYDNKEAYNNIQADLGSVPALDSNWYWSSCAYSVKRCWYVSFGNGDVNFSAKYREYDVLAASAFTYNY